MAHTVLPEQLKSRITALMKKDEFERMKFEFNSELDPVTKEPISLKFDSSDFRKVEDSEMAEALFKSAADSEMKKKRGTKDEIDISIKY